MKGLSVCTVYSVAQCKHIMDTGWRNRSVGYTLMNKDSSRSHSIFTISIEICAVGRWGRAGGRFPLLATKAIHLCGPRGSP